MNPDQLLREQLHQGLMAMKLTATQAQEAALISYLHLLMEWNRVYNLTAIRKPQEILIKHIFDSLIILPYLYGQDILDVGTGAGLPGVPLAIMQPQKHFVLLDSNKKKTRFLVHVLQQLGLNNASIQANRIEAFTNAQGFDTIMSRAFSSLKDFLVVSHHLIKSGGQFLAMKGNYPEVELREIPEEYNVAGIHRLVIPGLSAERHVVIMTVISS